MAGLIAFFFLPQYATEMNQRNPPRILTTTVGSYPVPDWLAALPSEQALLDATRTVFALQRQAGIDLAPPAREAARPP